MSTNDASIKSPAKRGLAMNSEALPQDQVVQLGVMY